MKCPECAENGLTSKVYSQGQTSTLMGGGGPYWGEDGVLHRHDPNTITSGFRCSNGHRWATKSKQRCPAPDCNYGKEQL